MLRLAASFMAVLLVMNQDLTAAKVRRVQVESIAIDATLIKNGETSAAVDWPADAFTIVVEPSPVDGKSVEELLAARHIVPDVEAIDIVYRLNPSVNSLADLDNVSTMRLPRIATEGPTLSKLLAADHAATLTVDRELKQQFVARVDDLGRVVDRYAHSEKAQPSERASRDAVAADVALIQDRLSKIAGRVRRRHGRPMTPEVITQLTGDAQIASTILADAVNSGSPINDDRRDKLLKIAGDVQVKSGTFSETAAGEAPARWPEVDVSVRTFKGAAETSSLKVYYVPEALQSDQTFFRRFDRLTSPTIQSLPEADYCFWAVAGTSTSRVTDIQCSEVRTNRRAEIHLVIFEKARK